MLTGPKWDAALYIDERASKEQTDSLVTIYSGQAGGFLLYGIDKVGVYFVAFDEIVPIFIQAQNQPVLSKVKWYGSDGSTLNNKLIRNTEAAAFAVKTGFPTPIYAVENDNDERLKHVEDQIHEQIERTPRSYASVAYDALWVAALAENNTKATHNINYLKSSIVKIADSYTITTVIISLTVVEVLQLQQSPIILPFLLRLNTIKTTITINTMKVF